jgi:hypothetical protein
MSTSTEPNIYRLKGYLGILSKKLKVSVQLDMQERLTLYMKAWGEAPATEVQAFFKKDGYFWIPRFFFAEAISKRKMGQHDIQFEWTAGSPTNLPFNAVLDPKRGQPKAVDRVVAQLKERSGGILVAPTGCGKTILGYAIGHRLNTTIGVLVYNKQMVKNWIETAEWLFGLSRDEIGIVQGDQCDLGKPVTIMMVQSLLSSKPYPAELYDQFGVIVADEVNRFGAPQWNEVMQLFSARYRVGMSADPTRDDGLDQLVQWHFGPIAHKVFMKRPTPDVVQVLFNRTYHISSYSNRWRKTPSGDPMPDSLKYDKLLAEDEQRNQFLVNELVKMRAVGRRILIFSRLKDHLKTLKQMFEDRIGGVLDAIVAATSGEEDEVNYLDPDNTSVTLLVGGLKTAQLDAAMIGDVIFCTYAFGRDAMNIPHIDTLVLGTPPGKVLQPLGRLRDKGPADRRPLLCLDPYENVPYSMRKASRREQTYIGLKSKVIHKTRTPG